jgi:hypothetical protein
MRRKQRGRSDWWWRKILMLAKGEAAKIKNRTLKIEGMRHPGPPFRALKSEVTPLKVLSETVTPQNSDTP